MRLFDNSRSRARPLRDARLTAINFVADAVNRAVDLREVADNALHAVLAVMKLDAGAVYVLQETSHELRLFAWRGLSEAFARQVSRIRRGDDAIIDSVLDGAARVTEDFQLAGHLLLTDTVRAGFLSTVLLPIRAQGFVVGLLALGSYSPRVFEDDELELIEVIANQLGNAMVNAQLQADLRASEEQYRGLVENSDDAIYLADPDSRPRFANHAFARMFGYSPEDLAALGPFARIHPDDLEMVRAAFSRLIAEQPVQNLEYRFQRRDDVWIDLQCSARVFTRRGSQSQEMQFIVREVTEIRRRQQQLVRRNRQLAALTTLAAAANSSLRIEEIARSTLEVARDSSGLTGGIIHLTDLPGERLRVYVQIDLPPSLVDELASVRWGEGMWGEVAATGQLRVYSGLAKEGRVGPALAAEGFQLLIIVPVKTKGEVLGTLALGSRQPVAFTAEVVDMVSAMGNQLGIALANARLYAAQVRENETLTALLDISGGSAQQLELRPLLDLILRRASELLQADGGYTLRFQRRDQQVEVVAATAAFAGLLGQRASAAAVWLGQIRASRQGQILEAGQLTAADREPWLRDPGWQSVLVVPLVSRQESIGVLVLTRQEGPAGVFTAADLALLAAFAGRAAVAIDNAQLLQDLHEKNELLRLLIEEAHHRIKNNLQMVSGLLQLQAETASRGNAVEQLRTANARIQAIAQVHHLLSQDEPGKVNAQTLITTIVEALVLTSADPQRPPEVSLELSPLWLSSEQAVALALIVNEVLANSLLHGRPPAGQRLRVRIRCRRDDGEASLQVCDNGGGLPPGTDWRQSEGQGMNIVAQLARVNLRGSLAMTNRDGGLCADLVFEVLEPVAAAGGASDAGAGAGDGT